MTDIEQQAREAAKAHLIGRVQAHQEVHGALMAHYDRQACVEDFYKGFLAAAEPREQKIRELRLLAEEQLTTLRNLKSAMLSDTRDAEIAELRAQLERAKKAIDAYVMDEERLESEATALRARVAAVQHALQLTQSLLTKADRRVAELEGMVPKWVSSDEALLLRDFKWEFCGERKYVQGVRVHLMVPPIPLPEGTEE